MSLLGLNMIDVLVTVIYFGAVLWIGYRAMKKVRNSGDYFLGGRQFGRSLQTFSQFGQRTPVNKDPAQDLKDVEESLANWARNANIRLFPGSNWEFARQPRYDAIGMTIAAAIGVALTVAVPVLARIGV